MLSITRFQIRSGLSNHIRNSSRPVTHLSSFQVPTVPNTGLGPGRLLIKHADPFHKIGPTHLVGAYFLALPDQPHIPSFLKSAVIGFQLCPTTSIS